MPSAILGLIDTLADWEVGHLTVELTTGRFTRSAWQVRTASPSGAGVTTMGGLRVAADLAVADVDPADCGLLILPGAATWESEDGAALVELGRRFLDAGVPVAAICGATEAFARAGLLDHRRHTGPAREVLAAQPGYAGGDLYVDERAVAADGLITAGPQSPAQFTRATLAYLDLASEETLEAWEAVMYRGDTSGYGRLMQASA